MGHIQVLPCGRIAGDAAMGVKVRGEALPGERPGAGTGAPAEEVVED